MKPRTMSQVRSGTPAQLQLIWLNNLRYYTTGDTQAAATAERLILAAGFDPVKAGYMKDAARIEGPDGDLSQFGLRGALVDVDQARAAVAATAVA